MRGNGRCPIKDCEMEEDWTVGRAGNGYGREESNEDLVNGCSKGGVSEQFGWGCVGKKA